MYMYTYISYIYIYVYICICIYIYIYIHTYRSAGADAVSLSQVRGGQDQGESTVVGLVANAGAGAALDVITPQMSNEDMLAAVLNRHGTMKIGIGAEKFECDRELALLRRAIPSVMHAFKVLADHVPPLDHDREERYGNTLKAMNGDQVRYELQVDHEHRASFRAFNDDGALNCEARVQDGAGGKRVEYIKVFFNHQIVCEKQNQVC